MVGSRPEGKCMRAVAYHMHPADCRPLASSFPVGGTALAGSLAKMVRRIGTFPLRAGGPVTRTRSDSLATTVCAARFCCRRDCTVLTSFTALEAVRTLPLRREFFVSIEDGVIYGLLHRLDQPGESYRPEQVKVLFVVIASLTHLPLTLNLVAAGVAAEPRGSLPGSGERERHTAAMTVGLNHVSGVSF